MGLLKAGMSLVSPYKQGLTTDRDCCCCGCDGYLHEFVPQTPISYGEMLDDIGELLTIDLTGTGYRIMCITSCRGVDDPNEPTEGIHDVFYHVLTTCCYPLPGELGAPVQNGLCCDSPPGVPDDPCQILVQQVMQDAALEFGHSYGDFGDVPCKCSAPLLVAGCDSQDPLTAILETHVARRLARCCERMLRL